MVTSPREDTVTRPGRAPAAEADPVLISKITAPGLPDWAVPRLRIATIMAERAHAPLTMVTGPPGAGKTMAMALWAATGDSPGPRAWMTVDEYDNRPRVFWSYVTAALRAAGVRVDPLPPAMTSGNDVDHGSRPTWPGRTRRSPWSSTTFSCSRRRPPWTAWRTS